MKKIIEAKKKILSHETTHLSSKTLKELSRFVAEKTVTILALKDIPFYTINKNDKVLFIGNNKTIFKAMKDTFKHTDILNASIFNYKKLYPETHLEEFIKKYDALIIEDSYTDAPHIISLCNGLKKKYIIM